MRMTPEWLIRYLHFIGLLTMAGTLAAEWLLVGNSLTRREVGKLARIDLVYGLASLLAVGAGLTLWLSDTIGKPAEFYSKNPLFMTKLTLVVLVGLLSLPPTIFFLRNRKGEQDQKIPVPAYIRRLIQAEVLLFIAVPLLATLMARGVGY